MDTWLHEGIDFVLKNASINYTTGIPNIIFFINIIKNVGYAKLFYFVKIIHGKPDCVLDEENQMIEC